MTIADVALPPAKPYHPTTFAERGVAVPFTTPLLAGTRARQKKGDIELVVPNPSGGRGVYIVPWLGVKSFCNTTLHDRVFSDRIAIVDSVTPASIRRVARDLAAEGMAGEDAAEAAKAATAADHSDRTVTNYQLVMTLVDQVHGVTESGQAGAADPAAKVRAAVAWVSSRLDRPTTWTASALEGIAEVMASIGLTSESKIGRLPRILGALRRVQGEIATWGTTQQEDSITSYVEMVGSVASFTVSLADAALADVRSLTISMLELLRAWAADPRSVTQLAGRPEWLLDGWDQICMVWDHADDELGRRTALSEIVGLVPVLPTEVGDWGGKGKLLDDVQRFRRLVFLNEDWRTGVMVFKLIARNERFRALSC